jgi:hypothetical protein
VTLYSSRGVVIIGLSVAPKDATVPVLEEASGADAESISKTVVTSDEETELSSTNTTSKIIRYDPTNPNRNNRSHR